MEAERLTGPRHVLVVDDHAGVCRSLARLLQFNGLPAVAAIGGEAALTHLAQFTPGLILLDLMMPDIDGMEVLRKGTGWGRGSARAGRSVGDSPLRHTHTARAAGTDE